MVNRSGQPVLTIVIPVRNRVDKLIKCLDTIRNGKVSGDRLEVVISDNTPMGLLKTNEMIQRDGVRVVRPEQAIHMTDNFEFGLRAAQGEWVLFLGADDGVVSHRLATYVEHLEKTSVDCVTGPTLGFRWPDMTTNGTGRLSWWTSNRSAVVCLDARNELLRVRQTLRTPSKINAGRLPMPYMHGAVRVTTLARTDLRGTGQVFRTQAPDSYISMALLHVLDRYEVMPWAIGIQGVSRESNGYLSLTLPDEWKSHPDRDIPLSLDARGVFEDRFNNADIVATYADAFYTAKWSTDQSVDRESMGVMAHRVMDSGNQETSHSFIGRVKRKSAEIKSTSKVARLKRVFKGGLLTLTGATFTVLSSRSLIDTPSASGVVEDVDSGRIALSHREAWSTLFRFLKSGRMSPRIWRVGAGSIV